MSPRKLTEDDKHSMLQLYRNSKATTSTLAEEFGVSSSTVSRFLKNSLSPEEYESLIQQKRLARTHRGDRTSATLRDRSSVKTAEDSPKLESEKSSKKIVLPQKTTVKETLEVETPIESTSAQPTPKKSVEEIVVDTESDRESLSKTPPQIKTEAKPKIEIELAAKSKPKIEPKTTDRISLKPLEEEDDDDDLDVLTLNEMLGEEIDDDDDDDEDEDDDDRDEEISYTYTDSQARSLEILPLSAASFPRTCYLVVDRAAELIVKPLQEFADLGTIPDTEIEQKTLPVFDNHRIAKRFSHRREKVIKVPDGSMLQKTASYLQEKGITRLLIRGQIYAISEN